MYKPLTSDMNDWNTGDLLLFHSTNTNCFGKWIQIFTSSEYSHVGVILKIQIFRTTISRAIFLGIIF